MVTLNEVSLYAGFGNDIYRYSKDSFIESIQKIYRPILVHPGTNQRIPRTAVSL